MREVKKNAIVARVVKMKSFSCCHTRKKPRVEVDPSGITLKKVKTSITKQGNLTLLSQFYDCLNEKGKRSIEEATTVYLNKYSKVLIEIVSEVPTSLYDILDMRKEATRVEEEIIREYELVQLCLVIAMIELIGFLRKIKKGLEEKIMLIKS